MPRRKRQVSGKKSLEFEESPVNIVRNLPSPVFWSDKPTTADVIECEHARLKWVSPQFTRSTTRFTRSRRLQRIGRGVSRQISSGSGRVGTPIKGKKNPSSKVVPLRFVGELKECPSQESINPGDPSSQSDSDKDIVKQLDTVLRRPKRVCTKSESMEQSPDSFTQLVPRGRRSKPVKRLFHSTVKQNNCLEKKSYCDNTAVINSQDEATTCQENPVHLSMGCNSKLTDDYSYSASPIKLNDNFNSSTPLDVYNSDSSDTESLQTGNKPLSMLTHALLPSTPLLRPLSLPSPSTVLAYDTPEDEYHLTVRQRQLKRYRTRLQHH